MLARRVVGTLLVLGILGCDGDVPDDSVGGYFPYVRWGDVVGAVTVAGESTPVAGAQVGVHFVESWADVSTVTDATGNYRVTATWDSRWENPPGSVGITVVVSRPDFEPVTNRITALHDKTIRNDVRLTPTSQCTGLVNVAVPTVSPPMFSWTPGCRLWTLLVEADSAGDDLWCVASDSANVFTPPVTYGDTPSGARVLVSPAGLIAGITYKVSVHRWTGPGPQDGEVVGVQKFTR